MAIIKFITVKGPESFGTEPFYVGMLQHERTMSKQEFYSYCADKIGYKASQIRAVFMAYREFLRENQQRGNITFIDGVASVRNYVKGAFEGLTGPWAKGTNLLIVKPVEMDPFKSLLTGIVPINSTEGATPIINTVFDEVTRVYDEITGTDTFSIAGANLAPDATKDDEYVALVAADGTVTKATITYSDLQNVKANLAAALEAGVYTLKVYTRSGLGDAYGVHVATRKITVA